MPPVVTRQQRRRHEREEAKRVPYQTVWKPQPGPQTAAIECPVKDLLYGGARGGGKTDFLLGDFAAHAQRWGQYAKGIIFRQSYPELEEIIARSHEIYLPLGAKYNDAKHTWTFPKKPGERRGATLKLRFIKNAKEAAKYQGHSYTWLGFDELGSWADPKPVDMLWATLRSAHVPDAHLVRRCTANPGGAGHGWVKLRYITPAPLGYKVFTYQPQPEEHPDIVITAVFIPAKIKDNPLIDPVAYRARLAAAAQGNTQLLKAWLEGDWDVFVGQAFHEWRAEIHIARNSIAHLRRWRWVCGLDWGKRKGCILLAAVSSEGDIEVVACIDFHDIAARELAFEVFSKRWAQFPMPDVILGDDQMWQDSGVKKGVTIATEFNAGLLRAFGSLVPGEAPVLKKASKGSGSRAVKYELTHRYLQWKDQRNPETGALQPWARPLLRIQKRCKYLIDTLPALPVDPDKPEDDVDTHSDDHGYDALGNILLDQPAMAEVKAARAEHSKHPGFTKAGKRKRKWHDDEDEELEVAMGRTGYQAPRAVRSNELVKAED